MGFIFFQLALVESHAFMKNPFPEVLQHDPSAIIAKSAEFTIGGSMDGDYLEFGVFEGRSLAHAYHAYSRAYAAVIKNYGFLMSDEVKGWVRMRWENMRFWGFDSYEGLPPVSGVDKGGPFKEGDYTCSLENVRRNLAAASVDEAKVRLVKGWFNKSLTPECLESFQGRKASVIHVDVDLYESAKTVLEFVVPLIADGTMLIFDDWFQFRGHPQKGEQRAFSEWLAAHPQFIATEYHKEGVWRNSFIINLQ